MQAAGSDAEILGVAEVGAILGAAAADSAGEGAERSAEGLGRAVARGVDHVAEDGGVEVSTGGTFGVTGFGVTEVEVSAVGKVDGVLGAGAEPLGAGAATTNKICSGMIGALIWEGADIPAEVTVAIVNV